MSLAEIMYSIGQWSGFLALVSLAFLIFSGDTARFSDRFFGLDKIIKFQRKFSLLSFIFLILHPVFFILAGQSFANYFIPAFYILPLALGTLAFYVFVVVMLFSYFYKKISYRAWQYIHVLTYLLFLSALYHAFFWGSSSDKLFFIITYIFLLLAIIVGAIYRTIYKIKEKRRGPASVLSIKWENDDIYTLTLKTKKKMNFKAGQFCFLRLDNHKLYARHPFSISSAPEDDILSFAIKNTGRFTSAVSKLQVGDKINLDGPFGIFTAKRKLQDVVFIAGGIGITPFRSLLKNFSNLHRQGKHVLIYCAKKEKDLVFRQDIENLPNIDLKTICILSEEKNDTADYLHGYLSKEILMEAIKDLQNPYFYICGPEPLKDSSVKIIKSLGISKERIIFESFFW